MDWFLYDKDLRHYEVKLYCHYLSAEGIESKTIIFPELNYVTGTVKPT